MHAAGVLSDAIYANQTWEKYCTTYNPKVRGGWNLHNMTKHLPLEHFVMYSSAVAALGKTIIIFNVYSVMHVSLRHF